MNKSIDTHCHLSRGYYPQPAEIVQLSLASGVQAMITVGCDLESSREAVTLAAGTPHLYASVGIHPHDAATVTEEILQELENLARHPKVVAIGETGLDYYRDRAPREVQIAAFRAHIRLARRCRLPLIVHDRDAHEDVVRILREEHAEEIGGVLHCFSGDLDMARACLDLGFHLSFAGPVTYSKNQALRDVAAALPDRAILIETDAPYLAPQQFRGKQNLPHYVGLVAETIASVRAVSLDDMLRITTRNAIRLFRLPEEIEEGGKIVYRIRNSLYLNITNRCTNRCTFCPKFDDFEVKGHNLLLQQEPDFSTVTALIAQQMEGIEEVVFCGYGEPLLRLDLVIEVSRWLKGLGMQVRVNTDGLANLVHGRNICPELSGLVDCVSVSLNAQDTQTYLHYCQPAPGEAAYPALLDFLRSAKEVIPEVVASAVTLPGVDIAACEAIASKLGVNFRVREYNNVG